MFLGVAKDVLDSFTKRYGKKELNFLRTDEEEDADSTKKAVDEATQEIFSNASEDVQI